MPKKQTKTKKPKSKKTKGKSKGKSTKSKSIYQHVNVNVHSGGGSGGGGSSMPQSQQQPMQQPVYQQQQLPQYQNMPSAFGDRRGEDVKLNNILKLVEQQGLKLGQMEQQQQVNRFDFSDIPKKKTPKVNDSDSAYLAELQRYNEESVLLNQQMSLYGNPLARIPDSSTMPLLSRINVAPKQDKIEEVFTIDESEEPIMKPVEDEEQPYIPAPIEHDYEPVSHPYEGSDPVGEEKDEKPKKVAKPKAPIEDYDKDEWKEKINSIGANKWSKTERDNKIKDIYGKPLSRLNKEELKEVHRQLKLENAKKNPKVI